MTKGEAKEHFDAGLAYLKKDDMDLACTSFEKAYKLEKKNSNYMSYYGMALAIRWGKIGQGLELCTQALKKEFFKADYYLNLGRVYLAAENKKGALTVFKKGLKFDHDNEELHEMLILLGVRKRQIIPFLKRSHPLNKTLGVFFRRTLPGILRRKPPKKDDDEDVDVGI